MWSWAELVERPGVSPAVRILAEVEFLPRNRDSTWVSVNHALPGSGTDQCTEGEVSKC